jgi:hypothetical protein
MQLSLEDVKQFFRLHRSLMFFVNQRLKVLDEDVADPKAYSGLPWQARIKVHAALLEHRELIGAFADENPFHFDEADLEIVRSWKHLLAGTFYVFRYLRNYTVFLSSTEPVLAYGVLALFDPLEVVVGPDLPRMIKTTLLPFKGRIVYDGLMTGYNVIFGPGIRRSLNESYKRAKERFGIIMSLPFDPATHPPIERQSKPSMRATGAGGRRGKSAGPAAARAAHDRIVALTDAFCREHLDDEYAALCRKLAGVLARKRPSPLTQGKPESWASGIVRAIGWVNFLGDPSQPHHMKMTDIDRGFGVSEATGSAKVSAIRKLLKLRAFDPEWTVPSMMEQNPFAWMITVNGLPVDVRHLPKEIQEEAFRKGLIPYIPGHPPGDIAEE